MCDSGSMSERMRGSVRVGRSVRVGWGRGRGR